MKKKILLLNPPGDKKYFRDYYCSKISKAHYYYHPMDLVYLSGTLSKLLNVFVIDAIAENLSISDCFKQIENISPDFVLFLISSPSYNADTQFLTGLKERLPKACFIGIGDIYREYKSSAFNKHGFLDAILLDFSTEDILTYLQNAKGKIIDNVIYKYKNKIYAGKEKHGYGKFHVEIPRWDLFKLEKYKFPFERKLKFASMLTDFGCPFKCYYCPMSTIGFKLREVSEVIKEIKLLKSLGVNELFFRDQTFGADKQRTIELCKELEKLNIGWTCFTRVDTITEELAKHMKEAGCHTIMFGIESSNEELLKLYKKNTTKSQIRKAIGLCKKHNIESVGTFILGLPEDTRESIINTIKFAKELNLDYASFNIAFPRFGTKFRKDALKSRLLGENKLMVKISKSKPVWKNQPLSNEEIFKLRKYANRSFYLRPSYIVKRLFKIRTFHQLFNCFVEAFFLFFRG